MDIITTLLLIFILFAAILRTPLFLVLGFLALLFKTSILIEESRTLVGLTDLIAITDDKMGQDAILVPIPLFCLVGYILSRSKTPQRIIDLVNSSVGWLPGSMGIVTIIACAFFTPFTGASGITIIALGGLLYPILLQERYSQKYSLGVMTSSGSIGLLFFPSLPLLVFALIGHLSITELEPGPMGGFTIPIRDMYIAGLLPGLLLIAVPSLYTYFIRRKIPSEPEKLKLARSNGYRTFLWRHY